MEDCLYKHEEWKADEQAEIRKNHDIAYPKCDYLATPWAWSAVGNEGGYPRIIPLSRPLRPGLKRRRYRNSRDTNSCATYYCAAQPRPPLESEESNVAPATPPHPTILHIERNNNTPKPPYRVNTHAIPYSTSQTRPPPWPLKGPKQNQNQHQHNGRYTPARYTMGQRPPPRPNIPTTSPILSIMNPHPPPWPNICHYHHKGHSLVTSTPPACPPPWLIIPRHIQSTPQNCRNAKRRIKAKSRFISDEVSI